MAEAAASVPAGPEPDRGPFIPGNLRGFGNHKNSYCRLARPERVSQLVGAVAGQAAAMLARGGGCAYGDVALNDGGLVFDLTRLDRMLGFDAQTGVLECESGIALSEIDRIFLPRGFCVPVVPGSAKVTLGGAIAGDIHGKNHDRAGSFGDHVLWLDLLDAEGEVRRLAPDRDGEDFAATIGGLGLTGIVLRAAIRLAPVASANVVRRVRRVADLDQLLANLAGLRESTGFNVAWIDAQARGRALGRAVLETAEVADAASKPARPPRLPRLDFPFTMPAWLPARGLTRLANFLYWQAAAPSGRARTIHRQAFNYPLDLIGKWQRFYGKRGLAQFQCVVDEQAAPQALRAMLEVAASARPGAFLGMVKSLGGEGRGHLSFAKRGITLALDFPMRGNANEAIEKLIRLCLDHGGRVNPSKDAHLWPDALRAMYPKARQFAEALQRLDPNGRFQSDFARRLQIRDYLP